MENGSKEQGGKRENPSEKLAEEVFKAILYTVMAGAVNNEGIRVFREEVDSQTGLANYILLARACEDFDSPDGKIVVAHSQGADPEESFVISGLSTLKLSDEQGKTVLERPNVVGIVLNPNSNAYKRDKGGEFVISNEGLYSVLRAVVEAQSLIEQKREDGTYDSLMPRHEFFQALLG